MGSNYHSKEENKGKKFPLKENTNNNMNKKYL